MPCLSDTSSSHHSTDEARSYAFNGRSHKYKLVTAMTALPCGRHTGRTTHQAGSAQKLERPACCVPSLMPQKRLTNCMAGFAAGLGGLCHHPPGVPDRSCAPCRPCPCDAGPARACAAPPRTWAPTSAGVPQTCPCRHGRQPSAHDQVRQRKGCHRRHECRPTPRSPQSRHKRQH